MKHFRRWWPVALAFLLCAYALLSFDWPAIGRALAGLDLRWVLAGMAAITPLVFLACALRWVAINQLPWRAGVMFHAYAYVSVVIGAAVATPMLLGEILKVRFARDAGMPVGRSAVNLALERVMDLASITAMASGGLAFLAWRSAALAGMAALLPFLAGLAAPALLQWLARRLAGHRLGQKLGAYAGAPLPPALLLLVALSTAAKWGLTLLVWLLVLRTAGITASVWEAMGLAGVVSGIAIASMVPGGFGVQELSVRTLLVLAGHDPVQAELAAVVLRLFTPVMVILGLAHLPLLALKPRPLEKV